MAAAPYRQTRSARVPREHSACGPRACGEGLAAPSVRTDPAGALSRLSLGPPACFNVSYCSYSVGFLQETFAAVILDSNGPIRRLFGSNGEVMMALLLVALEYPLRELVTQ